MTARSAVGRHLRGAALLGFFISLAGCSSAPPPNPDTFASSTTFQHSYAATAATTCEASRRVLLSQGYAIDKDQGTSVDADKNFEDKNGHMVLSFHVVCVSDHSATPATTVFANAVQDRYVMKKDTSTAGVGLSVLGSVSLPFMSSDDSLTKSSSVTITSADFYGGFFEMVKEYLPQSAPWVPLPPNVPPVRKEVEHEAPKAQAPAAVVPAAATPEPHPAAPVVTSSPSTVPTSAAHPEAPSSAAAAGKNTTNAEQTPAAKAAAAPTAPAKPAATTPAEGTPSTSTFTGVSAGAPVPKGPGSTPGTTPATGSGSSAGSTGTTSTDSTTPASGSTSTPATTTTTTAPGSATTPTTLQ